MRSEPRLSDGCPIAASQQEWGHDPKVGSQSSPPTAQAATIWCCSARQFDHFVQQLWSTREEVNSSRRASAACPESLGKSFHNYSPTSVLPSILQLYPCRALRRAVPGQATHANSNPIPTFEHSTLVDLFQNGFASTHEVKGTRKLLLALPPIANSRGEGTWTNQKDGENCKIGCSARQAPTGC
jgi:hypothetical protein